MRISLLLVLALMCLTTARAIAAPRDETLAAISRCSRIADDRRFLDCIYGAAQPLRAELGLPPAPQFQLRLVPPPPAARANASPPSFTMASPSKAPSREESVLGFLFGKGGMRMAAYNFDKRGLFTVQLTNGQVWQQLATDTNFAHFGGPARDYIVTLTPGPYSTRMDVRGEPGPYLVARVH